MVHFEIIFVDVRFRLRFSSSLSSFLRLLSSFLTYGCSAAPAPFIETAIFPPLNCFCNFVKNRLGLCVWVYFRIFCSVPLISVSIPPSRYSSLNCCSYISRLEIGQTDTSHFIFLFQNRFSCLSSFTIPYTF